jgi:hypothetical protein
MMSTDSYQWLTAVHLGELPHPYTGRIDMRREHHLGMLAVIRSWAAGMCLAAADAFDVIPAIVISRVSSCI